MNQDPRPIKEDRIVLRVDADFADQVDRVAFRRFDGNRSLLVRTAIRELLERFDLAERDVQEAQAA